MKIKKIKIPIFFGNLVIALVNDWELFEKKYNTRIVNDYSAIFLYLKKTDEYIIAIKEFKNSIIVHECVHCVNKIMEEAGIKHSFDNDETQAYLTGWVFSQIEKFIKSMYKHHL